MLRRCAPASEKPIWMPGSRASIFSTSGRWLEIVVHHRNALPCSSTRSKNASTGCSPPRSRPTSPNDLPTTDASGQSTISASKKSRCHTRTPNLLSYCLRNTRRYDSSHSISFALHLVAQVQRRRAGSELLEDHEVDAVGVDLERHRQMLPAEVAAETVDQPGGGSHGPDRVWVGLDVGGRQQAGLERVAEDTERLGQLRAEVERVLNVGPGLQDSA